MRNIHEKFFFYGVGRQVFTNEFDEKETIKGKRQGKEKGKIKYNCTDYYARQESDASVIRLVGREHVLPSFLRRKRFLSVVRSYIL